jgi:transposase-like protein
VEPENVLPLAPAQAFCPNSDCPAKGQVWQGNMGVHSQQERRFVCHVCRKTFSARKGTVFYRLQKNATLVTRVLALLAHGCPVQAIVAAFQLDERSVRAWMAKSGAQCQAVHEHLVERSQDLGQVQCDEVRVKAQGSVLWLAKAICVQTRLWLGAEVRAQRDGPLIERLIRRVKRCASGACCSSVRMGWRATRRRSSASSARSCTAHESLRLPTHRWSVTEQLSYRVPPARWRPPKRRGRQSAALKELIKQWG